MDYTVIIANSGSSLVLQQPPVASASEDLNKYSWFVQQATRNDAETFLGRCEPGRFIVRPSSMNGCLALSHKLPTLDIGHALIQSSPSGWTITGSDKSFATVEGLLRSRTLSFPKPGEYGAPNQMTYQYPTQGRVSAAADLASVEPSLAAPAAVTLPPPPAAVPVAYENNEALEKVLTCLVNPNNTTLELFSMNLTTLPSEVNDLHLLQQLYLSNNSFSELPREVLSLSALKTLWIQANNLTSLPADIDRLANLEKLKLSNNAIDARTGFPPSMARMSTLHEIWIENNKLDIFPPTLLTVVSLKRVWVDHNQIREIPRAIGRLVNLERLSMTKNLVAEVPREIGALKNLEKLWLNDNEVHTVAPEIALCSKLSMLALANNRISVAPDLSSLQFLTDLRLENNPCFNESIHGSAPGPVGAPAAGGGAGGVGAGLNPSMSPTIGGGAVRRTSNQPDGTLARGGSSAGGALSPGVAGSTLARNAGGAGGGGAGGGGAPTVASAAAAAPGIDHSKGAPKKAASSFKLPWQKREDNPLQALNDGIDAGDDKKVKALMKNRKKAPFDLAAIDADGFTPLNKAVKLGSDKVVEAIVSSPYLLPDEVNIKDKFGYTPLHWAVRGTNDVILHRLLEVKSLRVDVQNNDQNTPLHYFCERNHSPDCERIGQQLIDRGAAVNKTNNNGETPLHKAIFNSQVRLMMVRLLIKNNADPNVLTQLRQSPLQYAVRLQREDLVTMLLKAGARLDLRSSDGLTAHEVAVKERCDKIAALLAECEKLQRWLAALNLESLFATFVREEILFDQLADLREDVLPKLGITTAGQRMKLMKAVQDLRTERALHTMAAKERAAQAEQPPTFASNAANAEGEWLQQLTAGMDLREGEHIAFSDLELLEELGSGAAGKVFKGLYKGKHVAVKVLKELKDGGELDDFKKELEIMTAIRSPYMIFFYGVVLSPKLCIAEGALVQLAHGGSCAIEHLDELCGALVAAPRVVADSGDVRLARAACSRALDNGVKHCVRVALDDGRTLDCTPDHELLTADGRWLRADRLKAGVDRVAVAPHVPVADAREPERERAFDLAAGPYALSMRDAAARAQALAFARILGLCHADGSLNLANGQAAVAHALDGDALAADAALFDGCTRATRADGAFVVQLGARLLEALRAVAPARASAFALPDALRDAPTAFVREFVGGLFGGHASADHAQLKHAAVKGRGSAELRVYLTELSQLLERCGVAECDVSADAPARQSLRGDDNDGGERVVEIALAVRDARAFAQAVGFRFNVQKSERLALAVLRRDGRKGARSGDRFAATAARDADQATLGLLVRSVTALGARRVFDLTVPGPHAFVANGVAVHNCMVMEIATRKSLFHVLNRDNLNIGWPQALEWGAQAAGGTACLHQHNIVHRDLKSLNLLVTQDWTIKVADFGLARFNSEGNLETLSKMRGTMAYCIPSDDEILTNRGFMNLAAYEAAAARDGGLRVASYDAARGALTYETPRRLVVQPHATRTLVEFDGSRSGSDVGLLVTQEHRMYAQLRGSGDDQFRKIEAGHYFHDDALDAIRQKTAARAGYDGPNRPRTVAELLDVVARGPAAAAVAVAAVESGAVSPTLRLAYELLGVWVRVGALSDDGRTALFADVAPGRAEAWLRATLTALFGAPAAGTWSVTAAATTFAIHDAQWNALVAAEYAHTAARHVGGGAKRAKRASDAVSSSGGSASLELDETGAKWTPWWMWTLDAGAVRSYLRGVQRGSSNCGKQACATTASVRFRDELVRLCYQAGYTVRFEARPAGEWRVEWSARGGAVEPTLYKSRGEVRERQHTGRVWCFTMPSGFIWTRRVLATHKASGAVTAASRALLTGQCPPEAYFAQAFDYKSDVYSLAVILWELANRALKGKYEAPFSEYKNLTMDFQIIIQVAKAHLRPTIPERCPPPVRELIEGAWVFARDDRPTADHVQGHLRQLITTYENNAAAWDQAIAATMATQK